jgi:hypothetical protein
MRSCLLLLTLFMAAMSVAAQDIASDTSDEASVIYIDVQEDAREAYRTLAATLERRGYTLEHSDSTGFSLTTAPRQRPAEDILSGGILDDPLVSISGKVVKGQSVRIVLTGTYSAPGVDAADRPILHEGEDNAPARKAWRELLETALAYPHGRVSFVMYL